MISALILAAALGTGTITPTKPSPPLTQMEGAIVAAHCLWGFEAARKVPEAMTVADAQHIPKEKQKIPIEWGIQVTPRRDMKFCSLSPTKSFIVDLGKTPAVLLGGRTELGKSVLLLLMDMGADRDGTHTFVGAVAEDPSNGDAFMSPTN